MIEQAKWIWIDDTVNPKNQWICLRKEFEVSGEIKKADIKITADSKYLLYVNGELAGRGPARAFTHMYYYDSYDFTPELKTGKNVIAVIVNHIGMNTSQYTLGRAGFIAAAEIKTSAGDASFISDKSFMCAKHTGFIDENIKISCGQAFSELFDASKYSDDWMKEGFDGKGFTPACEIGDYGMEPWGKLRERDIPFLTDEPEAPRAIAEAYRVLNDGVRVNIDFNSIYFGEIRSPEFFYITTNIKSPKAVECDLVFPTSRLWCTYGKFTINGREYATEMDDFILDPRGEGQKRVRIRLDEGDNIFGMDCKGTAMGYYTSLYIDCGDTKLEFISPFHTGHMFSAVTSLLNADSNKVDMGSYWLNLPKNPEISDEIKEKALIDCWEALKRCDKEFLHKWARAVKNCDISFNHPQHATIMQKRMEAMPVSENLNNALIANRSNSIIQPDRLLDTELTIDFGEQVAGFIEFELTSAYEGEIIDMCGFEYMDRFGKKQHMDGVNCALRYKTKKGRQRFVAHIFRSFRYLMVTFRNKKAPLAVKYIGIRMATYPVTYIGEFQCSDEKLNKIYEISQRTSRLCMLDTFVDCPGHEQTFWTGDFRNEALIAHYLFDSGRLVRHCHEVALGSLKKKLLPEGAVPAVPQDVMPTWALLWMMSYWELYLFTGNKESLKEFYPYLKQCMQVFIDRIGTDGLVSVEWNDMMDWAAMDTVAGNYNTNLNSEVYKVLGYMGCAANELEQKEDSKYYFSLANKLKKEVTSQLWNDEKQAFADCLKQDGTLSPMYTTQANVMAYMCDCVTDEQKDIVTKYLTTGFPEGYLKIGSPFASFFYHEALGRAGEIQTILDDIRKMWGQMIDYGATTCFETFPGWEREDLTRSHCHAWSASPAYVMGHNVLGIIPVEPGFKKVRLCSFLGDLAWAKGAVPVPNGRIVVDVQKNGDRLKVKLKSPKGIVFEAGYPNIDFEVEYL